MHQGKAVNLEQVAYPAEISVELADTDMLHHANGNHAVESAFERPVVEFVKLNQTVHPGNIGVLAGNTELLGRDIDCSHPCARGCRDVDGEGTPPGADLGYCHALA